MFTSSPREPVSAWLLLLGGVSPRARPRDLGSRRTLLSLSRFPSEAVPSPLVRRESFVSDQSDMKSCGLKL